MKTNWKQFVNSLAAASIIYAIILIIEKYIDYDIIGAVAFCLIVDVLYEKFTSIKEQSFRVGDDSDIGVAEKFKGDKK